ncbi:MAG: 2,3-bisphosphoglycerate-independent phosphoglycerate mutase [Elioraea sp.]|nr:2,3-bisphosphoglycerate-independent phosphoglycerate mutase [Elioraea sp.]
MTRRPVMLVVLDGWGWREEEAANAVRLAHTPTFDRLWQTCPHAFLRTSGADVGLPEGQMGNSEVGHLNLGAGRVVLQDLPRIDAAVADGSIARRPAWRDLIARVRASGRVVHLMGLVSPGGVHSHQDHAVALARMLAGEGIAVAVHAWTDGRDTPPRSAESFLARFERELPAGTRIATLSGRYYAMDRDHRWDRIERAWAAMVLAEGERAESAAVAVRAAYARELSDEFILPTVIGDYAGMRDGDAILCFNFRADRVRQILAALLDPAFDAFPRPRLPRFAAAVAMTPYSEALDRFMAVLFPPEPLVNVLGEVVAKAGRTQLRLAETEKYPHVTYFLNGGREAVFPGEERVLIPSPKVATYDLKPEMSAPEVTKAAVAAIRSGRFDLIVLNYANPDMVGHTGDLAAAIAACEAVDRGLGEIVAAIADVGGVLLVTADHGNAELMRDPETGGPHTAHTTNPVPVILFDGPEGARLRDGRLADVAPTVLALMGLAQPAEMTGKSLLN